MGFFKGFKEFKEDFSSALSDLVPGDDTYVEENIPDDSQTLNGEIDADAEFSKLDGLLEKVENKSKELDDGAIFKSIEEPTPVTLEEPVIPEAFEEPASTEFTTADEPVTTAENVADDIELKPLEEINEEVASELEAVDEVESTVATEAVVDEPIIEPIEELAIEEPELTEVVEEDSASEEVTATEETITEEAIEEPVIEETVEEPVVEEVVEEPVATEVTEYIEEPEDDPFEKIIEEIPEEPIINNFEETNTNTNSYEEEIKMDSFSSITPEVTESQATVTEPEISLEVSDEVSVITEGTKIKGNMETAGSFEIRGHVEGDLKCNGKLTVTGTVIGASSSSEFFADASHIEGEIVSSGTVKVGLGSVIMGNITATSAVIAGAVKGDIDVQGPVVIDASAVILGNIKSKSVVINNGAVIEGFCSQCYSDVDVESLFGKN